MSRSKVGGAVTHRLAQIESLFSNLLSSINDAKSLSLGEYRAALIVGARALNLFLVNFSLAEGAAATDLVHLNSRMLRLGDNSSLQELSTVGELQARLISAILSDAATRRKILVPEGPVRQDNTPRLEDDGSDCDTDDESTESPVVDFFG